MSHFGARGGEGGGMGTQIQESILRDLAIQRCHMSCLFWEAQSTYSTVSYCNFRTVAKNAVGGRTSRRKHKRAQF